MMDFGLKFTKEMDDYGKGIVLNKENKTVKIDF